MKLREEQDKSREIHESELRYRALIEAIPDAIVVHSEGRIVFANPAAAEMFRAPNVDAVNGQAVMDFVAPSERKTVARRIQTLLRKQRPAPMANEKLQRLDGEIFHAEVHAIPVDYLGKPAVQVIAHDISERRKAKEDLQNMASFAEHNPGPVLRVDENGKILNVNPAANKILDNGIVGNPIAEAVPPLKEMDIGKLIALGKVARCEYRFGDKCFKFTVRGVPELGVAHIYGTDITQRMQAEEGIKNYRNRLNTIIETSNDIIFLKDREFRYMIANSAHEKLFDVKAADIIGKTDFDFMPQEIARKCRQSDELALESQDFICKEEYVQGGWFESTKHAVLDGSGNVTGIVGVIRDITERKLAEEKLKESEDSLSQAQRIAHLGSWNWDIPNNKLLWTDEIFRIFSLNPEKEGVSYRTFLRAIYPDDRKWVSKEIRTSMRTGESRQREFRIVRPDGSERYVHAETCVICNEKKNLVRMIGTVLDITERKRFEAIIQGEKEALELLGAGHALTDVLNQLALLIEDQVTPSHCAISLLKDGGILSVAAAPSLPPEYIGDVERRGVEPCLIATCAKQSVPEIAVTNNLAEALNCDACQDIVLDCGHTACWSIPLLNEAGATVGDLCIYHNLGRNPAPAESALIKGAAQIAGLAIERRQAEDELRQHREHLEEMVQQRTEQLESAKVQADSANRAKSSFLATMSHELRTPLNSVIGFSELMADGLAGDVTDKQKEYLGDVLDSSHHLLSLINDILDLSKIESGKMVFSPDEFDLAGLLEASLTMVKETAMKHTIRLDADIPDDLGTVTADKRKVKQTTYNLLSNAVKFTPNGGSVRLRARKISKSGSGKKGDSLLSSERKSETVPFLLNSRPDPCDGFEISVADTGLGISKEDQKKLFQPFRQLDSSLARKFKGTGLGLVLCKRMVELHGGRIWLESEEAKGSIFTFTLPGVAMPPTRARDHQIIDPETHLLTWEHVLTHSGFIMSLHQRMEIKFGLLRLNLPPEIESQDYASVARLLKEAMRKHEILGLGKQAREFCIILLNTDKKKIKGAIERLRRITNDLSIQINSVIYPDDGKDIGELVASLRRKESRS